MELKMSSFFTRHPCEPLIYGINSISNSLGSHGDITRF